MSVEADGHVFILIPTKDKGWQVLDLTFGQLVLMAEMKHEFHDCEIQQGVFFGGDDDFKGVLNLAQENFTKDANRAIYSNIVDRLDISDQDKKELKEDGLSDSAYAYYVGRHILKSPNSFNAFNEPVINIGYGAIIEREEPDNRKGEYISNVLKIRSKELIKSPVPGLDGLVSLEVIAESYPEYFESTASQMRPESSKLNIISDVVEIE